MMTIHQWALSRQTWFCEETSDMAFSGLRDVVAKKASKGNAIVMHCHLALAYTLLLRGEVRLLGRVDRVYLLGVHIILCGYLPYYTLASIAKQDTTLITNLSIYIVHRSNSRCN